MRAKYLAPAIVLTMVLGAGSASYGQALTAPNSPSASNQALGATTGLGSSHRFARAAAAQAHCGNSDTVVWSDGYHLTYDLPGSADYGKSATHSGFYACKSEADSAGFHAAGN
jgi:hypothetical protein